MRAAELFVGPDLPTLESRAFDLVARDAGMLPDQVLYLAPFHHIDDEIRDRWTDHGQRDTLNILTIDDFAGDTVERATHQGRATHIYRSLLYRLVEQGLERLHDPSNPLASGDRLPSAGLTKSAEDLFTRLEFAGLLSPDAIEDRLHEEGLGERAEAVGALARNIESAREAMLEGDQRETFRTERMHAATTTTESLERTWPEVEAVVVGGLTRLRPLELALFDRIVETWPTAVLLPHVNDSVSPVGVDTATKTVSEHVADIEFDARHHVTPDERDFEGAASTHDAARRLFRYTEAVTGADTSAGTSATADSVSTDGLAGRRIIEPETVTEEVRHVARDIRASLDDDLTADQIGIALPAPDPYHPLLAETLEQYDVPAATSSEVGVTETAVGEATLAMCDLATAEPTVEDVLGLLSNPLVTLMDAGIPDDDAHQQLAHTAARSESRRLSTVLRHLPEELQAAIETVLDELASLASIPLEELPDRLADLQETLGIAEAVDDRGSLTEREALANVREAAETVALTASVADPDLGSAADRLARALQNGQTQQSTVREAVHVVVCDCNQATRREFTRLYVLGLTESTVPSTREDLRFVAPIFDAHPDFDRSDPRAEFRHQFGRLVAAPGELVLSVPQRTEGGDPLVEAEAVTELRRVADVETEAVTATTAPPGTNEDIQRSMGSYIGHEQTDSDDATTVVDGAREAGTIDAAQQRQFRRGIECAAARASERLTLYDGQLTPETLAMVHDEATREPYSASRLETFAACGFKYYMERVLGIEEPDELTIEPDALAKGSYVHDVLEHYYRALQDAQGTPIPLFEADPYLTEGVGIEPVADDRRDAVLLDIALDRLDEAFDAPETAYHEEWLTKVLAGLGGPAENPYYESGAYEAPERGLFGRFIDGEANEVGLAGARPAWFEPRVGQRRADEFVLQDSPVDVSTPRGSVPVTGQIDRIDTVPGSAPRQLVVRDYKTGSAPTESETLAGLQFQLPLYAILAETTLDDVETIGGSYYKVNPSPTLNHRGGQIGSEEHTGHVRYGKTEKAMGTKQSYPHFEDHDEFRSFITDVVPERLGTITSNIEQGRFHPTVLDPGDAGCSYCPYADVCDVRPHERHAVIDWLDDNGVDAYVPPIATDADLDSALEVR